MLSAHVLTRDVKACAANHRAANNRAAACRSVIATENDGKHSFGTSKSVGVVPLWSAALAPWPIGRPKQTRTIGLCTLYACWFLVSVCRRYARQYGMPRAARGGKQSCSPDIGIAFAGGRCSSIFPLLFVPFFVLRYVSRLSATARALERSEMGLVHLDGFALMSSAYRTPYCCRSTQCQQTHIWSLRCGLFKLIAGQKIKNYSNDATI